MHFGTHQSERAPFAPILEPARLLAVALIAAFALAGVAPAALAFSEDPLAYQPELDDGPLGPGRPAYRERRDPDRALESYRLFKRVVDEQPDDAVALWHLALSCYYLGQRVFDTKEDRQRVFHEGYSLAETAVDRAPGCAPCHMLAGVNQALWGQEVGIFRVLSGLPNVKRHLRRSTEIDPAFAGASALRVRSQIARVLPRWLGGGKKKARRHLLRAIETAPQEPLNYQFLAKLLFKDFGDREGALRVARQGLELPMPGPEFVESVDSVRRLERYVAYLEK